MPTGVYPHGCAVRDDRCACPAAVEPEDAVHDNLHPVQENSPPQNIKAGTARVDTVKEKRVQTAIQSSGNATFTLEFIGDEWHYVEIDPAQPDCRRAFALDDQDNVHPIFLLRPTPPIPHGPRMRHRPSKRRRCSQSQDEKSGSSNLLLQECKARAVNRLVSMLQSTGVRVKEMAADALGNVAKDDPALVVSSGAIPLLISILTRHIAMTEPRRAAGRTRRELIGLSPCKVDCPTAHLAEVCVNALSVLVCHPAHIAAVAAAGAIPVLVAMLSQSAVALVEVAAHTLSVMARREPYSTQLLQAGAAPALVSTLASGSVEVQQPVSFCLSIISQKHPIAVVQAGGAPVLMSILLNWANGDPAVTEMALSTISNIARDRKVTQAVVGAIPLLSAVLRCGTVELQRVSAQAICFFAKHELHTAAVVSSGAVPALVLLMREGSTHELQEVAADVLRGVVRNQAHTAAVVEAGAISVLLSMLNSGVNEFKEVAADILSCIARNQTQTHAVVAAGVVPVLKSLLKGSVNELKEVAADALSNIARNPLFTDAVVSEDGLLSLLVSLLQDRSVEVQMAAAETITVVAMNPIHAGPLVAAGASSVLWTLVQAGHEDLADIASDTLQLIHPDPTVLGGTIYDTSTTAGYESRDSTTESAGSINCIEADSDSA